MQSDDGLACSFPRLAVHIIVMLASLGAAAAASADAAARTPAAPVGAVMAALATFQDAGALPPEHSPEASRLIKGLIQFQGAFMKSDAPAVRQLLAEAAPGDADRFRTDGWSSRTMEAVIDYAERHDIWTDRAVIDGFGAFNVGADDFTLLARTFRSAKERLAGTGRDIHTVYAARRATMPGARTNDSPER
ncbi:MAG TPA: hypothetical protein VFA38_00750 [Nitrospirales bacterium]|nr:hypothetical protein [Nitrospirales bacterium]